jgi:hypothetical protein
MNKRIGGTINNWWINDTLFGKDSPVVMGRLQDDSKWGESTLIRTSTIVSINEDETELETLNTIYKLGEKRVDGMTA